jgi:hypothetical protein
MVAEWNPGTPSAALVKIMILFDDIPGFVGEIQIL